MKFKYEQVQRGAWGETALNKFVSIEAGDRMEADLIASRHKSVKRLRNGDMVSLRFVEEKE